MKYDTSYHSYHNHWQHSKVLNQVSQLNEGVLKERIAEPRNFRMIFLFFKTVSVHVILVSEHCQLKLTERLYNMNIAKC